MCIGNRPCVMFLILKQGNYFKGEKIICRIWGFEVLLPLITPQLRGVLDN